MPKYLFQGSYRPEGTKGLMKEGASQRRTNLEALVKQQGGRLEAFYFTFGEADAIGIAELPDNVTAAALSRCRADDGVADHRGDGSGDEEADRLPTARPLRSRHHEPDRDR